VGRSWGVVLEVGSVDGVKQALLALWSGMICMNGSGDMMW